MTNGSTIIIDGSGSYLRDKISLCHEAIKQIEPDNESTKKLIFTVDWALDATEGKRYPDLDFERLAVWVNDEYIQGYFRRMIRAD